MKISYRLGQQKWGERQPERIPTLELFIDEFGAEYSIDLDELAEALKPFLKEGDQ